VDQPKAAAAVVETLRFTHGTSRWAGAAAVLGMSAGLLAWLWPIGLGSTMPVGGDVTQFFMGLMSVLSESLAAHRLPVWNDLWGYGFPGIGESQMGAFYPPHLALYGALSVERAYVASLVLHTLWGGLGAYWAGRVFGLSRGGAAFSAFVFSTSGFFVIHMPHPWGYTTGSWLPWAWGAAWRLLDDDPNRVRETTPGTAGRLFVLALVLVLQVLPGHFQIAFMTQVGIVVMALWACLDRAGRRSLGGAAWRGGLATLGLAVVFPLAAVQLWPTARLARLAASQRDYEYLSGFAETPFHLVNLVAPNLFHQSPLWRPIVWDPFHTSPEECLIYVGVLPLFLAILAVAREIRRDSGVRCLAVLAVVGLILSLGPYVPGFRLLIELPGFSFFRAPARWTLPTSLALAILAGKGLDAWPTWVRPGRRLGVLAVGAALWTVIVLGLIELALWASSPSGSPVVGHVFTKALAIRPWTDDQTFKSVAAQARTPVLENGAKPRAARSFEQRRFEVYRTELGGTVLLLVGVVVASGLSGVAPVRRFIPIVLVALTGADLWLMGRHRLVDVGPLRPLTEQSPVLARLAEEPRGTRTADPVRNLSMAAGLAPVQAYRTLDLPALASLTSLVRAPLDPGPQRDTAFRAMRAAGVGLRVLDPSEASGHRIQGAADLQKRATLETFSDPALARWLFGASWNPEHRPEADAFMILKPSEPAARAWFLPSTAVPSADLFDRWTGDPRPVLDLIDRARPLRTVVRSPIDWEVALDVEEPGWVLISQLDDPQWQAQIRSADDQEPEPANIAPAFRVGDRGGAWQRIYIGKPTDGAVLRLSYDARDVRLGQGISAVSWLLWVIAISFFMRRRSAGRKFEYW
jgi:hypothetical protein